MNIYRFLKIISLLVLTLLTFSCSEQNKDDDNSTSENTQVSGTISSDTVWTLDKSPYIVVDDVVVERDGILTIEPQVEIRFERGKGLTIKGILIADGSAGFMPSDETELIKFTSNQSMPDIGDWRGINFDNTNNDKSVLKYTKIRYAEIGIRLFSSSPLISDNFIEFNKIGIRSVGSFSNITHNVIWSNIDGVHIHPYPSPHVYRNTISHNEVGIVFWFKGSAEYNNFIDNTEYSILTKYNGITYAKNNWWNTIEIKEIEKQIYHKEDKVDIGRILYMPYSTSPILDAYPRF